MSAVEFIEGVWRAFMAVVFVMLALRELGITKRLDPLAALVTVMAIGAVAQYVQVTLR